MISVKSQATQQEKCRSRPEQRDARTNTSDREVNPRCKYSGHSLYIIALYQYLMRDTSIPIEAAAVI